MFAEADAVLSALWEVKSGWRWQPYSRGSSLQTYVQLQSDLSSRQEKKKGCVPFRKTLVKHNMPLKSHYLLMRTSSDEMINIACMKLKRRNSDTEVLVVWFRQLVWHVKTRSDSVISYLSSKSDRGLDAFLSFAGDSGWRAWRSDASRETPWISVFSAYKTGTLCRKGRATHFFFLLRLF